MNPYETDSLLSPDDSESSASSSSSFRPLQYRNKSYMSEGAFETIAQTLKEQATGSLPGRNRSNRSGVTRSSSISSLNTSSSIDSAGRRALYGSLPFFAAFGMQQRESQLRRVLSSVQSIESLGPDVMITEQMKLHDEIDIDEIIVTIPLIMAVVVAMIAQFLVGYNTAVMNAPEPFVFPGHSLMLWSVAVAIFAIGKYYDVVCSGGMMMCNSFDHD